MRLSKLDLTRYGKFTDCSLSFDRPSNDGPDLHVIYGANEAGKSTLLSGWLDLLFSIPTQSKMNFLHPHKTMQLGAELEMDGQAHQIVRVKKRLESLLDAHGAPIGEALLHKGLHGLDRGAYAAMFSLNGQTLVEGGEHILASQGDLGQLLFSSSAGVSNLSEKLTAFRQEAEEFLSASGRKGRLLDLKTEFDHLGTQLKELDTAASEYARLAKERDTAKTAWTSARTEAETAIAQSIVLERQIGALPLVDRLHRLERQIDDYGNLPVPPAGWVDELPALDRQQTEIATRIETATNAVAGLQNELGKTPSDQIALDLADRVAAAERLKSGYDTALDDLPKRIKDRDGKSASITACLSRLGQKGADPGGLLPEAGVLGSLRGLIEARSGVDMALANATQELEATRETGEDAQRRLKEAGGVITDPGGLVGLVGQVRRDDPIGALERVHATHEEEQVRLNAALADLLPWQGDRAALSAIHRPDDDWIAATRSGLATTDRANERAATEVSRLESDVDKAEARLGQSIGATTVTLEQAATVRAGRETLWSKHRTALTDETADTFEQAMRLDDQVSAAVSTQQVQAEKTSEAETALTELRLELQTAKTTAGGARTAFDALCHSLAETIARASDVLDGDTGIDAFAKWLARVDVAKNSARLLANTEREVTRQEIALGRHRADLLAALERAGHALEPDTSVSIALETAQSLLDREARVATLRDAVTDAAQDIARRQTALDKADATKLTWQDQWAVACDKTWMVGDRPDVSAMRAILDELAILQESLGQHDDLDLRIRKMQDNQSRFEQALGAIADTLGLVSGPDTLADWRAISNRLRLAEQTMQTRNQLAQRLETAQRALDNLQQNAALHRQRIEEITGFFGKPDWPEAREALTRAGDRADLSQTRDDCVEELCARMQVSDSVEATAQLQGLEISELQAQATTLKTDTKTLGENQEEGFDAFKSAERAVAAIGGDGAVALLAEQRQTLLLEMEEGARQHLRKRLGVLAVDSALRRYRDTHRSGMLERASQAFSTMSRGRYTGLNAQPDGTKEVLVAASAEGGSKEASQLSDGTRAQLYLALRIAGYYEFVSNNGPVPFIADDIMESFDNERTTEALSLLAEMSNSGQVIYLTHHAHVCDLAKSVCPNVQVHELMM